MADRPHALSRLGGQSHVSLRGKAQEGRIGSVWSPDELSQQSNSCDRSLNEVVRVCS